MDTPQIRVLVVEDSADDAELIVRLIKKGGYSIYHERVDTAQQMRDAINNNTWDIIISDYKMPGFSGIKALEILKEYNLDIPFILVSGTIGEQIAVEAMKKGATDYLMKDNLSRLVPAIEREIKEFKIRANERKAQSELKESEEKFRSYVENANDIVYTLTLDGVFIYVSPNWTRLLGHAINEVENHPFQEFMHPDDIREAIEFLDRIIKTGEKQAGIEYRVLHKNGTWRWHTSNASPMYDTTGKVISYLGIARDITKHKQAEELIKESEEKYRELVENANSIIAKFDKEGRIISMNEFGLKLFGYNEEELIGKTWVETILPKLESTGKMLETLATDVVKDVDKYTVNLNENVKKNGERVWIYWTNKPLKDENGEIDGILSVGTDVTDKIIADKQMEQNVEYFAHLVDHIRNPLAILSGFVQVKVDDEETRSRVMRQVDRIEEIIKQLDRGWMDTEDTRKFLKKHR